MMMCRICSPEQSLDAPALTVLGSIQWSKDREHAGNSWRDRRKSVSCVHLLALTPKLHALKEKNNLCTVSHMGSRQLLLCLLCPSRVAY